MRGTVADELRTVLDRGEARGGLEFDGLHWPDAEKLVRIMLADAEHFEDLDPEDRRRPAVAARERELAEDLIRLREVLSG